MLERSFIEDSSGKLEVAEIGDLFRAERFFIVRTSVSCSRGFHAHRECKQALFSLRGQIEVRTIGAGGEDRVTLTEDGSGLLIPNMVWGEQTYLDAGGGTLLVLASHRYNPRDYIRNFASFLEELRLVRAN